MNLFPHTLIRIGGSPFDRLNQLIPELEIADQIFSESQKLNNIKAQLSELLFKDINKIEDQKSQNFVLNLRRDIHNNRNISEGKIEKAKLLISEKPLTLILDYLKGKEDIALLIKDGEKIFNQKVGESREQFKVVINEDSLQNGLILSSRDLLDRIPNYQNKHVNSLSKNDVKAELSLLKYITRICAKTSPYSTFTNLIIAGHDKNEDTISLNPNSEEGITSHVRLNNYLYKYLKEVLLNTPAAYNLFLLRPNPTIQQDEENILFLTNNNNLESFQRMEADAVLELFMELLSEKPEGLLFKDVVSKLSEYIEAEREELEAYIHQLVEYGFLEFNIGVSGIDPDWDIKLREKLALLEQNGVPLIKELIEVLITLRNSAKEYETADLEKRKSILSERFKEFKEICMKLHEAAGLPEDERKSREELREEAKKKKEEAELKKKEEGENPEKENVEEDKENENEKKDDDVFKHKSQTYFSFKPEQIFYEDTTLNTSPLIDNQKLDLFIGHLNDLLQQMKPFVGMQDSKEIMHNYFINKYGKDSIIDLFTFYEDYYKEYKKPEAERLEKIKQERAEKTKKEKDQKEGNQVEDKEIENKEDGNVADKVKEEFKPITLDSIKERSEALKNWKEKFYQALNIDKGNTDSVNITADNIAKTNKDLNLEIGNASHNSFGTFMQMHNDNGTIKGVLNSSFSGYGKLLSRFLHIFDDKVTDDMRKWNMSLNEDVYFIENCDASYFNANLHPPLLPYEVWMPGGHNSLPENKQIPITDFAVKVNQNKNTLSLIHKPSGKPAFVFDLGFQGQKGRSELFQLLCHFSLTEFLFTHPVSSAINEKYNTSEQPEGQKESRPRITLQPRIEYENTIILQRKGWNIPFKLLPIKSGSETNWEYFVRINQWRHDLNIPDEVFIFVNARSGNNAAPANNKVRTGRDDYKPQYINFKSPLLVNLFEKALKKVPYSLKIEEMAPGSDQLLKMNDEKYVTEFMLQWYNYDRK